MLSPRPWRSPRAAAPPAAVVDGQAVAQRWQRAVSGQAVASGLAPQGETVSGLVVDRVVDGDTVKVELDGDDVSVRLIGMNTPETVKPDSPVECFGPESSDFAKETLTGARVTLEFDESQGRTDQYDRVLAYVWRELPDGSLRLFNLESIAGGYAFERQYGSTRLRLEGRVRAGSAAGAGRRCGPLGSLPGLLTLLEHGTHGCLTLRGHPWGSRHAARQRRDTMSDTTGSTPAEGTPDTTPTEALQLADQEPIAATPAASAPAPAAHVGPQPHPDDPRGHRRCRGGGLIVTAGAVGFAVGHATGDDDGRWTSTPAIAGGPMRGPEGPGPDASAPRPEPGQGREPGDGFGHRDGDGGRSMVTTVTGSWAATARRPRLVESAPARPAGPAGPRSRPPPGRPPPRRRPRCAAPAIGSR